MKKHSKKLSQNKTLQQLRTDRRSHQSQEKNLPL